MTKECGFVYVFQHDAMPGMYKVGMTLRSPHQRARELSSMTGVPGEFQVVAFFEVEDPCHIERYIHSLLDDSRIEGKEFFRCPLSRILSCLEGLDDRLSEYFSDISIEAKDPGSINPYHPLWFEQCLHESGYLLRVSKNRLGGAA